MLALGGCVTAGGGAASPAPAAQAAPPASATVAPPTTVQLTTPARGEHNPTTESVLQSRLERACADVPPGATAARLALGDVAYPRSQAELTSMGGFAVLLVTALSQQASELPVARVEVRVGAAIAPLPLVAARAGEQRPGRIAETFGRFRHDAVFLIPVFATRARAEVVVYLGGGRYPMKVLTFPIPREEDAMSPDLTFDGDPGNPEIASIRRLLDEELPVMAGAALLDH